MHFTSLVLAVFLVSSAFAQYSSVPSGVPTDLPTDFPTDLPTGFPTDFPSSLLSNLPTGTQSAPPPTTSDPYAVAGSFDQCCSSYLTILGQCANYFVTNPSQYPADSKDEMIVLIKCMCNQAGFLPNIQACSTCLEKTSPSSSADLGSFNATTFTKACADPAGYLASDPNFQLGQNAFNSSLPLPVLSIIAQIYATSGSLSNTNFLSATATSAGAAAVSGGASPASGVSNAASGTGSPSSGNPPSKSGSGRVQIGWVASTISAAAALTVMMMMI